MRSVASFAITLYVYTHTLAAGPHLCYEAGVECQRHCAGLWVQGALRKHRSVRGPLLLMCGATNGWAMPAHCAKTAGQPEQAARLAQPGSCTAHVTRGHSTASRGHRRECMQSPRVACARICKLHEHAHAHDHADLQLVCPEGDEGEGNTTHESGAYVELIRWVLCEREMQQLTGRGVSRLRPWWRACCWHRQLGCGSNSGLLRLAACRVGRRRCCCVCCCCGW